MKFDWKQYHIIMDRYVVWSGLLYMVYFYSILDSMKHIYRRQQKY